MISKSNSEFGVSVIVGFILLLSITAVGVSLIIVELEDVSNKTSDNVSENQVNMASVQMVSYINTIDTNVSTATTKYTVDPPDDSIIREPNVKYKVLSTANPNTYTLRTSKVSTDTYIDKQFTLENSDFNIDTVGNSRTVKIQYTETSGEIRFYD